ncbi:MAG: acetylglutamate kinase [Bacteroidota bacterium]
MKPLYIIKVGGGALEHDEMLHGVLKDFSSLQVPKILTHGGGKTASQMAQRLGIAPRMIDGRRITDAATLEVVLMVYGGLMNKRLVSQLQAFGVNALGLTGADLDVIRANRRPVKEIDYGFVGDVSQVNGQQLNLLISHGITPVVAPLTHDGHGQMLNTNADTIASAVAQAMAAMYEVHLVICFEKTGVLRDVNDPGSLLPELKRQEMKSLQQQGIIADGMLPKLSNAFEALQAGVKRVFICHVDAIGALGSSDFVGTEILL